MYLFDKLPLDIIRYEIIPNLNYHERTAVNLCLPPQDRMGYPLTLPDIVVKKYRFRMKAITNVKDPYWSSIQPPHIVEYPRAPRPDEMRDLSIADLSAEERRMNTQLRRGQRIMHIGFKEGIYEREPGKPMRCRCC
jgi:hypothetical protein